jgi:hypothetical protein
MGNKSPFRSEDPPFTGEKFSWVSVLRHCIMVSCRTQTTPQSGNQAFGTSSGPPVKRPAQLRAPVNLTLRFTMGDNAREAEQGFVFLPCRR